MWGALNRCIAAALVLAGGFAHADDLAQYRHDLHTLEQQQRAVLTQLQPHGDFAAISSLAPPQLSTLADAQLEQFRRQALSHAQLQSLNQRYSRLLAHMQSTLGKEDEAEIEIEPIEVSPSICEGSTYAVVYSNLIAKTLAEEVLAAAKWYCREEIGGENAAIVCLPLEEIAQIFRAFAETNNVCLDAQKNARQDALLETVHSAAEFLETELDVKVSDLASVEQMTDATTDTQQIEATLNTYLPTDLPGIEQAMDRLLQKLAQNEQKIFDILTRSAANEQWQLINDAESQDIDQRSADLQQLIDEINADQLQLLALVNQVETSLHSADLQTQADDHMAWAISQGWGQQVVPYQVPIAFGGQLERVRELVAQTLLQAQNAGVKISAAQAAFTAGDAAFNSGKYQQAYQNYAEAFRTLGTVDPPNRCAQGVCNE